MTEEVIVIAKWDYTAQQDQELDIRKNERLWLLDDSKTWWRVRNASNKTGYVPSNYVERKNSLKKGSLVKNLKDTLGLGKTKRKTSTRDASPTPSTDAEYPSNGGGGSGGAERIYDLDVPALVKFAYAADREDELTLVKGTRVVVMEKCSDGWWRGSYAGQVGWFPSNYVQEEGGEEAAGEHQLAGKYPGTQRLPRGMGLSNGSRGPTVLHTVQTLYPFSSVTDEELNFEKGETMEVLEKPENDPEWWKCKNSRGQVGLVPKNYVVVLSDGPAPGGPSHHTQHIGETYTGPSRTGKFAGKDWYYGNITRHQAECALNERGVGGDFLVRDSESSPSDFSVSLKAAGKNKHFKVQLSEGVYCIGQRRFSTMDELVEHYKKAPIFTSEQGDKLYLVKPLHRRRVRKDEKKGLH
ncbi:cytoplasmic protein NCK2b isoform X1 [Denticeps clupeoides]|uniref:cytoplasmic protein NCK2b isoform X1 n=1 Tax=Denticeps clupeoides TaxID=299321 RepID=UPI0010A59916|nr:cytoplasmic protein NCK2-like isoform X1 [Denticeps clupeoides]XP_028810717.1 cytoplasmic protein NCK2-like isoform X1 [Denticeps clupeoides]XP_028810718.1 cytoplasmic protein NCK2-like isoform X1 [Denticeps clupeoides]XP_028810719.1 cytoplasmic protein NCK2-like isoform X1 [Denticeps clupeoides]XP_028810721.1 cytoplasmic protein NCK2-like isoform X1 [Denticeps clupeoides]XP_028810722.1 cytoplasmic protein NCK2-like isoform X1 [Denticeps clupeoides]